MLYFTVCIWSNRPEQTVWTQMGCRKMWRLIDYKTSVMIIIFVEFIDQLINYLINFVSLNSLCE